MPTFLAFAGQAQFAEWVDVCQSVIPVSEWVLRATDADLINQLPQSVGSAEVRQLALSRIRAMAQPTVSAPAQAIVTVATRHFEFQMPVIAEASERIRATEPATRENVRAFLWHNGQKLPEGFSAETLEAIVRSGASDVRLLTAFFHWATAHGHAINASEWAEQFRLSEMNEAGIAAVASLLSHCSAGSGLSRSIRRLVEAAFEVLGVALNGSSVERLLRSRRGAGWLLARNVARLENGLCAIRPLVAAALEHDNREFMGLLPSLTRTDLPDLFAAAADLLLEPLPQELYLFDDAFPPAYAHPPQLLGFFLDATLPYTRPIDGQVLSQLLDILETAAPLPLCWVEFFAHVLLDDTALGRVQALFDLSGGSIHHALPTLFQIGGRRTLTSPDGLVDSDIKAFFCGSRPSLVRTFVRSLRCAVLPGNLLSRELFRSVTPLLTPVFPTLAYGGTAALGLRLHAEATPLSAMRFGVFSPSIGAALMRGLCSRSWEALAICVGLLQLSQNLVRLAVPDVAPAMAREEVLRRLLDSAVAPESNIYFAARAIECALYCAQEDQVMVVVANADFLTRPNFACVCVIFGHFVARVSQQKTTSILDFCRLLQRRAVAIFPDELRRRIIADLNEPSNIAALLHDFSAV
jgi:hypothetical protein